MDPATQTGHQLEMEAEAKMRLRLLKNPLKLGQRINSLVICSQFILGPSRYAVPFYNEDIMASKCLASITIDKKLQDLATSDSGDIVLARATGDDSVKNKAQQSRRLKTHALRNLCFVPGDHCDIVNETTVFPCKHLEAGADRWG